MLIKVDKKLVIFVTILIIVSSVFVLAKLSFASKKPQNLVIFSVDTLRADYMGLYGYPKNTTPNLDNWSKNASVFQNALTPVPMTQPSFASLMTGKNPLNSRMISNFAPYNAKISPNSPTFARILRDNGFSTAAFVSSVLLDKQHTNFYVGFDEYYTMREELKIDEADAPTNQQYEVFIDKINQWLEKNQNKKFFLWIHLYTPHAEYNPMEPNRCKFNRSYCDLIAEKKPEELQEMRYKYQECKEKTDDDTVRMFETLYEGEIYEADQLFQRFITKIHETKLDKRTLIVFHGDHGEGFDHDYNFNHRSSMYHSSVKIPLIIKNPYTSEAKRIDRLVMVEDILPTTANLLGIKLDNRQFDGQSFSQVFSLNPLQKLLAPNRKGVFLMDDRLQKFAYYNGNYKYIYSPGETCLFKDQREELYNLHNDPQEKQNLINQESILAKSMRATLLEYLSKYNLPQFISEPQLEEKDSKSVIDNLKSLGY